jgi:hypothetical protein
MSDSRSRPSGPRDPRNALDALLAVDASPGNPIRRAMQLDALDHLLRPHLPPSIAAHARLANINGARLVFVVDSPVWHARLRLAAPALLEIARSFGLDVAELVVKTTTRPLHPPARAIPRPVSMSAAASKGLQAALASLREPADGNGEDAS